MAKKERKQHVRKSPDVREAEMLAEAVKLAGKWGTSNVSPRMLAEACNVSASLPRRYFATNRILHAAIDAEAARLGVDLPDEATTEIFRVRLWKQSREKVKK